MLIPTASVYFFYLSPLSLASLRGLHKTVSMCSWYGNHHRVIEEWEWINCETLESTVYLCFKREHTRELKADASFVGSKSQLFFDLPLSRSLFPKSFGLTLFHCSTADFAVIHLLALLMTALFCSHWPPNGQLVKYVWPRPTNGRISSSKRSLQNACARETHLSLRLPLPV